MEMFDHRRQLMTHNENFDGKENRERKVVVVHNYNSEVHGYGLDNADMEIHLMTHIHRTLDGNNKENHERKAVVHNHGYGLAMYDMKIENHKTMHGYCLDDTIKDMYNMEMVDHRRCLMTQSALD
ncbi:3407_t:CDS:1, partial [Paraglomus brasilianum]